jgi:hypothetical protein
MASGGKSSGVMPPAIILAEGDFRTKASWSEKHVLVKARELRAGGSPDS